MNRRAGRPLQTDIEPAAHAIDETLHTIRRTLTSSVRVAPGAAGMPVQRLRHLNLQQLAALEIRGLPMRLSNALSNPDAVFVLTLVEGDCTLACQAGTIRLRAGQFTLLRGDRTMQAEHAAPFLIRSSRVPAPQLEREMPDWRSAELLPIDATAGAGRMVAQLQQTLLSAGSELTSRSTDAFAQAFCCVLADALRPALPQTSAAAGATPAQSQAEHHKRRIRAHVRQRLGDADLDAAGIAAGVGLSVGHVHRLLAGEALSLAAWIQAERLEACRTALLAGSGGARSLTELALSWGFRDPAHFSRSFKRRFGVAPSVLRAQARVDAGAHR